MVLYLYSVVEQVEECLCERVAALYTLVRLNQLPQPAGLHGEDRIDTSAAPRQQSETQHRRQTGVAGLEDFASIHRFM